MFLFQCINFIILLAVLARYAYPPLKGAVVNWATVQAGEYSKAQRVAQEIDNRRLLLESRRAGLQGELKALEKFETDRFIKFELQTKEMHAGYMNQLSRDAKEKLVEYRNTQNIHMLTGVLEKFEKNVLSRCTSSMSEAIKESLEKTLAKKFEGIV